MMAFMDYFQELEDPRSHINRTHDLLDVLFLTISAILSGAEGWQDIKDFGDNKLDWLRKFREFKSGIPVDDTIARIISRVNPDNLRKSVTYSRHRSHYEKTKHKVSSIGERCKPQPNGRPGFIRIDTVHQGDKDKRKGVYHINAVDEYTQFEVVCTTEKITDEFLLPILQYMLKYFPFRIISFHSDNGSEYINQQVARLLKKLLIKFTKSRPRHSNDNALAESKNASVVRKILGYQHIPQKYAPLVNEFNKTYVNPHINYHRPCFFPVTITNKKGKQQKIYPYSAMMTPYDKLKSLPNAKYYLKSGMSFEIMDKIAYAISDNQSAEFLQQGRQLLFKTIDEQELGVA